MHQKNYITPATMPFVISCTHQDDCGNENATFSVRVESVPCCNEALTCSRTIILELLVTDLPT